MFPLSRSFSREIGADDVDGVWRLHRAPPNPSDVKINVEGAFIVDDESPSSDGKSSTAGEGVYFENKDIRLPHHTAVVSHVAVDVYNHLRPPGAELADASGIRLEGRLQRSSTSRGNRTLRMKVAA